MIVAGIPGRYDAITTWIFSCIMLLLLQLIPGATIMLTYSAKTIDVIDFQQLTLGHIPLQLEVVPRVTDLQHESLL